MTACGRKDTWTVVIGLGKCERSLVWCIFFMAGKSVYRSVHDLQLASKKHQLTIFCAGLEEMAMLIRGTTWSCSNPTSVDNSQSNVFLEDMIGSMIHEGACTSTVSFSHSFSLYGRPSGESRRKKWIG